MTNFLQPHEQEILKQAQEHLIVRDSYDEATRSIAAVEACLNGGPSPEQAKLVNTMLLRLLQGGKIQVAGVVALSPIVQKLKALEAGE